MATSSNLQIFLPILDAHSSSEVYQIGLSNSGSLKDFLPNFHTGYRTDLQVSTKFSRDSPTINCRVEFSPDSVQCLVERETTETMIDDELIALAIAEEAAIGSEGPVDISKEREDDLEGAYFNAFEKAYFTANAYEQLFYLEKLAAFYLEKQEYLKSSYLFTSTLNAAITYKSDPLYITKILSKLQEIEEEFLYRNFKIVVPSNSYSNIERKREVLAQIRKAAKEGLDSDQSSVVVQANLTKGLQQLLIEIIEESMAILNIPANNFAVISLGSMAREEMSPYSDIEFAFLIKDESQRGDFRKLAKFLEIKITNLGETRFDIIRFRRMEGIDFPPNSFCPSGFSMDIGGLSPLGKPGIYELIGTPVYLAFYQSAEWVNKNEAEIILTNAMASSSKLMGDEYLFVEYKKHIQKALRERLKFWSLTNYSKKRAINLLKGHIEEFGPHLSKERIDLRAFNVKKEFYRPFQMILESLSLYYNLQRVGSLKCIEALRRKGVICSKGAENLSKAYEIATFLRFQAQLFYGKEEETMLYIETEEDIGFFQIFEPEAKKIIEIYRTLIPFHLAILKFVKGDKQILKQSSFYDSKIGQGGEEDENAFDYSAAEAKFIEAAVFNPGSEALNNLGRIKQITGDFEDAKNYYEKALIKLKGIHREAPNNEIANCLDNLGLAHLKLSHTTALELYLQAFEMRKLLYAEPHLDIASSLNNLGLVSSLRGNIQESLDYHVKALQMQKSFFGEEDHFVVAKSLNHLGAIFLDLGQTEKAVDHYTQALKMQKLLSQGKPHIAIPASLNGLARAYTKLDNPRKSLELLEEALEMQTFFFGNKPHPMTVFILSSMGNANAKLFQGEALTAIDYHCRALDMLRFLTRHNLFVQPQESAFFFNDYANTYFHLEDYASAIKWYNLALERQKLILRDPHPITFNALIGLSRSYMQQRQGRLQMDYYEQASDMGKSLFGEDFSLQLFYL